MNARRALVTGATGYIGSRLVPALLEAGWTVRVLTRDKKKIAGRDWASRVEVAEGSATNDRELADALRDVDVAYYLIHSMDGKGDFVSRDRTLARRFGRIALEQNVGRLVYLSGLYPEGEELSEHLGSRKEVQDILLASGVPTVVLRAAVILGAGSASFEMLRHLTDRLPIMIAPKWLDTRIEPIAIRDVVHYLVGSADMPAEVNRGFDIGAGEIFTYRQMIDRYASVSSLGKRHVRTVPVMTPGLASHWVGLVTPVPASIAKPLVGSLIHEVVCKEHDIADHIPDPDGGFLDFDAASREAQEGAQARPLRSEVDSDSPGRISAADPSWAGRRVFEDRRVRTVHVTPAQMWAEVERLGGSRGWHVPDLVWRARGAADQLVGGPGHHRQREDGPLAVGDRVDSWVVESLERDSEHDAELVITVRPGTAAGTSELIQESRFTPSGLLGLAYWGGAWLAHVAVFAAMHSGLATAAERAAAEPATDPEQ